MFIMADIAFFALTFITIATAIISLESKEIVYGAISLALFFLSLAGFYVLLDAPFVAMFQLIVYVGAVAVLIIFTVMLVKREKWIKDEVIGLRYIGAILGLTLGLTLGLILIKTNFESMIASNSTVSILDIGIKIMNDYWIVLEVLALLLAVALIGAITMAKLDQEDS